MEKYKPILTEQKLEEQVQIDKVGRDDLKYLNRQGQVKINDPIYLAQYKGEKVVVIDSANMVKKMRDMKVIDMIEAWTIVDLIAGKNKKYTMYWVYQ